MPQSNIYSAGAASVYELFSDYLESDDLASEGSCIVLALSTRPVGDAARNAIQKSLAALGFGAGACTYATLAPANATVEGGDVELDAQALFALVEGLDPVRSVIADAHAADALATAYRTPIARDTTTRVFGRETAVFADLDAMMQTEKGKQKAWALFKALK